MPSISTSDAASIELAALTLLAQDNSLDVPQEQWPKEIRVLQPKKVRISVEGIYIVTSSFFTEEVGIFVPRDPATFSPKTGSDPEYKKQHGHVFSYRIRG